METRAYNVFKFDELSKDAKQKAIDKWYEREDYPFLSEDLTEDVKQLDTLGIFSDIKLRYSLNCCQGDGLSFSASIDVLKYVRFKKYPLKKQDDICNAIYKMASSDNNGRYFFAHKDQIDFDINDELLFEKYRFAIVAMKEDIQNYYMDICKQTEKYGYSVLEYRMDDKEFSEFCESNEYMFKENGTLD